MNYNLSTRIVILFALLLPNLLLAQKNEEGFIKCLISNSDSIINFVNKSELERANRLGISYTGFKNKWLIGFDIDEHVKSDIKEGRLNYDVSVKQLEDGFSVAEFSVPQLKYSKTFYFKDGEFVPPSTYFARSWQTKESKYFIFRISEPKYFNDYCVRKLDEFVDKIADTLEFSENEIELLNQQKIYYTFCKDENEVGELTGYKSKGQAILAYDEIITAFQTHYHELVHLLINYKLKNLGLYTLPFFMEGFAVAMGGRGGMAPRVVTDLGYYLQKTGFLTYDSILTNNAFMSQDANMTYAVSGLYNTFLFNELGVKKYLELYKSVNGDLDYTKAIKSSSVILPSNDLFQSYISQYQNDSLLILRDEGKLHPEGRTITTINEFEVRGNYYYFYLEDKVYSLPSVSKLENQEFRSRKSKELYDYGNSSDNYIVKVDTNSLKIYNIYNDELILSYEKAFSTDTGKSLSYLKKGSFYELYNEHLVHSYFAFLVKKIVFDNHLIHEQPVIIDGKVKQ